MKKNILITGYGFLAKSLVRELLKENHFNIFIVSKNKKNHNTNQKNLNFIICDISNWKKLKESLSNIHFDYLFHLAAKSIGGSAESNPVECFKVNIEGTWNIFQIATEKNIKGVVLASTMNVYNAQQDSAIKETDPLNPKDIYSFSKFNAENLARLYHSKYDLPVAIVRIGQIFGPGDIHYTRLVPSIIKSILKEKVIKLLSPSETIVDLIYVEDLAAILTKFIASFDEKRVEFDVFNISNETPISIESLTRKLLNISKRKKAKVIFGDRQAQECFMDNQKINSHIKDLRRSGLDQSLRETYNWYLNNLRI